MGRFARQYPEEAIAELYRLTLDAAPPLTVRAAVDAIAASPQPWACAVKLETARAYVRDERRKRGELRAEVRGETASQLRERLLVVCGREVSRVERASRRGKVDPAHVRTLGQAIRELETGTARSPAPTRARADGAPAGEPRGDAPNGQDAQLGPAASRMLERARQAQQPSA